MRSSAGFAFLLIAACTKVQAPQPTTIETPPAAIESSLGVTDWNSLRIAIVRSPCFGACPAYQVEVRGDGHVRYCGRGFVKADGERTRAIPTEAVRALFSQFVQADYFSMSDSYDDRSADGPTTQLVVMVDGKMKCVFDRGGRAVGMPPVVANLQRAIEEAAGSDEWVGSKRERESNPETGRCNLGILSRNDQVMLFADERDTPPPSRSGERNCSIRPVIYSDRTSPS